MAKLERNGVAKIGRKIQFSNEILDDYLIPKMTEPIVNSQLTLFSKVVGQQ